MDACEHNFSKGVEKESGIEWLARCTAKGSIT
jgi:hypothetical protein